MTLLRKLQYYIAILQIKRKLVKKSGYPLAVTDSSEKQIPKSFKIYGNSAYERTPSPDTPISFNFVGGYNSETKKYDIPILANGDLLTTISLDAPLKCAGNAVDTVGFSIGDGGTDDGDLLLYQSINVKVLDGTEDFSAQEDVSSPVIMDNIPDGYSVFRLNDSDVEIPRETRFESPNISCSHFESAFLSYKEIEKESAFLYKAAVGDYRKIYFAISNTRVAHNDVKAFKAWLASENAKGTPVTILYEGSRTLIKPLSLGTEDGYAILMEDGESVIGLENNTAELLGITIPKGNCIITVGTQTPPSKIEIEYYADVYE